MFDLIIAFVSDQRKHRSDHLEVVAGVSPPTQWSVIGGVVLPALRRVNGFPIEEVWPPHVSF